MNILWTLSLRFIISNAYLYYSGRISSNSQMYQNKEKYSYEKRESYDFHCCLIWILISSWQRGLWRFSFVINVQKKITRKYKVLRIINIVGEVKIIQVVSLDGKVLGKSVHNKSGGGKTKIRRWTFGKFNVSFMEIKFYSVWGKTF